MLHLSAQNIRLNCQASSKDEAIRLAAQGLVENGNVAAGYEAGMLARETQTSTFLGNGIAIPHGTLDTRDLVLNTGVQVLQFPNGVAWGDETAYVVIGIAAKSDEHLSLLRQLTTVLGDEETTEKLAKTQNLDEFIALLSGKSTLALADETLFTFGVESDSLLTLSAINAAQLQEKGYVNQTFISDVLASQPLHLGDELYLADSSSGNLANGVAFAQNKNGRSLITVAVVDNTLEPFFAKLADAGVRQTFRNANAADILALLGVQAVKASNDFAKNSDTQTACNAVVGTFTLRNDNGLHARPATELVKTLKAFEAKVSVENLDRPAAAVNAKSSMKILALGATQGHRLRFVAEGADAQQAIDALATAFASGLGESVSFVPSVPDTVETAEQAVASEPNSANAGNEGEVEATFTIKNAHGLHARPSAVLVNEVKKYNATIQVQNLDRDSQLVSAKSLMKIVALGVQKGHRLRFVATGEDAQQALDGIGAAIDAGLGE